MTVFPSIVKQWLKLPDHNKNASSVSVFNSLFNFYFWMKSHKLPNFVTRK